MNDRAPHSRTTSLRRLLIGALILGLAPACHHRDRTTLQTFNGTIVQISSVAEIEPNDESASPHFLGVLRHGEMRSVTGHAKAGDPLVDPTADEFDGFAISLAEPSEIEFRLTFNDVSGELDAWVYDPAIDDIALFFESDFSPETGLFYVDPPVLDFHLVVRALFGEANYTLDIIARPIPYFASTAAAAGGAGSEAAILGVRPVPDDEARSDTGLRAKTDAHELSRRRYLGLESPELGDADDAVRSGTLLVIDANGTVLAAPIHTVAPGLRIAPFE